MAALVAGSRLANVHLNLVMRACHEVEDEGDERFDQRRNKRLKMAIIGARKSMIPENYIQRIIQFARQGFTEIEFPVFNTDWDSEAYLTVAGQNSNNSVRVTNAFLEKVLGDGEWELIRRTDGAVAKRVRARDLWDQIGHAAWACADPGIQFDTTVNDWHTCPESGRINASNPCSGIHVPRRHGVQPGLPQPDGLRRDDGGLDVPAFVHAVRLWTVVLEISVMMAQYPSARIAQLSYEFRTLGLGYANIGGYLMASGIPYDSDAGRAICGAVTALMTGTAYATSAEMAGEMGTFSGFARNREAMLRVIGNHRRAAHGESDGYDGLSVLPVPLDRRLCPDEALSEAARDAWDNALTFGQVHGYRNAQVSVIAPTGTIGLIMGLRHHGR